MCFDWYSLPKAVLKPTAFLSWKPVYEDQTKINHEGTSTLMFQWFLACSLDEIILFIQSIRHRLAIKPITNRFLTWPSTILRYTPLGTLQLTFIILFNSQGNFLLIFFVHLNKAGEWRVGPGPTREMLIKQLVWEMLNTPTCSVVIMVCNEDIHKWELVIRDLDPSNGPINALSSPWMSSWQMCSMLTIYTRAPK